MGVPKVQQSPERASRRRRYSIEMTLTEIGQNEIKWTS